MLFTHRRSVPGVDSRNAGMEERMRRTIMVLAVFFLVAGATMVFAQSESAPKGLETSIRVESDIYPVRVDVSRIYAHGQGYRVVYRKGSASFAELYIPASWFNAGSKAILVRGIGPQYPYMVVYYKSDGSFSHVKLFAMSNMKDSSWGVIEGDPGDKFKVEALKLEF
jgi:hypothetical protein